MADWVLALQATALPCLFVVVRVVVLALVMMMREGTSRFAFLSSGPGALRRGPPAILSIPHPSRLSLSWPGRGNQSYLILKQNTSRPFGPFAKFGTRRSFFNKTELNKEKNQGVFFGSASPRSCVGGGGKVYRDGGKGGRGQWIDFTFITTTTTTFVFFFFVFLLRTENAKQ